MYQKKGKLALMIGLILLALVAIVPGTAAAAGSTGGETQLSLINPSIIAPSTEIKVQLPDLILPVVSETISIKAIPLYRTWNGKVHWYTSNKAERDTWLASGFSDEGITCYISPVPLPGLVPLYKCMLYGDMYYATSAAERDAVVSTYGFSFVGIEGYALPGNQTSQGDVNVNRWYHPESDHSDGWEWIAGEKFVSSSEMDRHHFYQVEAASIPGYNYEGVTFRAWSSAKTLQRIKVTAPNGGEELKAGDVQEIQWTSSVDDGIMNLYYATDGGAANSWTMIKENLSNNGSYSWTVPNKSSSNVVVQARWNYYDNQTDAWAYASDTSDAAFKISGSSILIPGIDPGMTILKIFPSAPTGLTVAPYLFTRLDLAWKDNSSNETGFTIERKTEGGTYAKIAGVGANVNKYSDTGAQFGTKYFYRVKATGAFDSAYSNEATGLLQKFAMNPDIEYNKLIPAAPTGLAAAAVAGSPDKVKLTWNASSSSIDGYIVERKSGAADWKMTSTVGADKTSVTESGLNTDISYSYRVRAYNMFLNSKPSNVVIYNPDPDSAGDVSIGSGTGTGTGTGSGGPVTLEFFIGKSGYSLNGAAAAMDATPLSREGRTLLPIRFVTEAIGAEIKWSAAEGKVQILQDGTAIELWIGKNQARINGLAVPIDGSNPAVMPLLINGRTMMPLRFIAENLGCEVEWIGANSQIIIRYQGKDFDPQPEPPGNWLNPQPEPPME